MYEKMKEDVVDNKVEDDELLTKFFPISCPTSSYPDDVSNTRRELSETNIDDYATIQLKKCVQSDGINCGILCLKVW